MPSKYQIAHFSSIIAPYVWKSSVMLGTTTESASAVCFWPGPHMWSVMLKQLGIALYCSMTSTSGFVTVLSLIPFTPMSQKAGHMPGPFGNLARHSK
jgi:hypothetical protein